MDTIETDYGEFLQAISIQINSLDGKKWLCKALRPPEVKVREDVVIFHA